MACQLPLPWGMVGTVGRADPMIGAIIALQTKMAPWKVYSEIVLPSGLVTHLPWIAAVKTAIL